MKYVLKKLGTMIITLLLISFLVFAAFSVIPGDPALSRLGTNATPERLEQLREEMGLNGSLMSRYGTWLAGFVRGDFGKSYSYNMSVGALILDKLPITLCLSLLAILLVIGFSLLIGIHAAKHEGKLLDRIIVVINQMIMAIPPFFAGILISALFGLGLHWFVPGRFVSYRENLIGFLGYLIAPAVAIALPKIAMAAKLLRSSLVEHAGEDYIRTAYSRGNSTKGVLYHHALKNALIPLITFWGMAFTDMIAGSVVIEQVFGIPGIGRILITSIANRDYPEVEAIIMLLATLIMVVNMLVDIIYRYADPRMRQSNG